MDYRIQTRRYSLDFRAPVRTSHGRWTARDGLFVRAEGADGSVGYGEAAPVPGFATESVDEAEEEARRLGDRVSEGVLDGIPPRFACLRNAVREACGDFGRRAGMPERERSLGVAALLAAGRAAVSEARIKADAGFRVFKWKVGIGDISEELGLLDDLCAALPSGARLRLDANGAWRRRQAERWLERCAERPVEFIEQPAAHGDGDAQDLLLGLARDYPVPIALDESVTGEDDIQRWLGAGWPGLYVIKPSLLADPEAALAKLAAAKARVIFSSALETGIGARSSLRRAFNWTGEPRALGFGVWPIFADARFDGPPAAPFLRWADVERIMPETLWKAMPGP